MVVYRQFSSWQKNLRRVADLRGFERGSLVGRGLLHVPTQFGEVFFGQLVSLGRGRVAEREITNGPSVGVDDFDATNGRGQMLGLIGGQGKTHRTAPHAHQGDKKG